MKKLSNQPKISQYLNTESQLNLPRVGIKNIPSLIKWTGSKRSQAQIISKYIPPYKRYFEPFLGSGALLYLAAVPGSIVGDIYKPLIDLWLLVQNEPQRIISNYKEQWEMLQDNFPNYYYIVRERFNSSQNPFDLNLLSRTCVNGIIRFNSQGHFNNSLHVTRKGMTPDKFSNIVELWHERVQGVKFVCQDYYLTISEANENDFVYFDPPYASSNNRYIKNLDTEPFYNVLMKLNDSGVKWALSFDGKRGEEYYIKEIPNDLYKRHILIHSGNSAVKKVLSGPLESVKESLYLNF